MNSQLPPHRPWSVPVALEDIPESGRHVELAAGEEARAALAKLAGVMGLPRLECSFDLARHGANGLHVVGTVSATVDQACVVTLEAVRNEIEEPVDLLFMSEPGPQRAESPPDVATDEPPEHLQGGMVDLGAVATEFLLLGIDPYPRKPGVVFDTPAAGEPAGGAFAALAALKNEMSEKDR
jgi:uncharacterized metal-binding protein YceD (DUF177 family)